MNAKKRIVAVAAAAAVAAVGGWYASTRAAGSAVEPNPAENPWKGHDPRKMTETFLGYYRDIVPTAKQQAVIDEALGEIPAPCCQEFSIATCCCPCNMAKSVWGLSRHLVVEKGKSAQELRQAVRSWLAYVGTGGFTGDACFTGGCGRPFSRNGCGGMDEKQLVFDAPARVPGAEEAESCSATCGGH